MRGVRARGSIPLVLAGEEGVGQGVHQPDEQSAHHGGQERVDRDADRQVLGYPRRQQEHRRVDDDEEQTEREDVEGNRKQDEDRTDQEIDEAEDAAGDEIVEDHSLGGGRSGQGDPRNVEDAEPQTEGVDC